jgi:hypothetical protein
MRISDYLRESCALNQKNLDRVKAIEKIAYPSHMQFYGDFDDIDDVIDYADCDGQIDCIIQDDWYAIFCNGPREVEVIDLAARRSLSLSDLLVIYQKMTSFGNKIFTMNARASTSYRLIKLGEKRGMFEILLDEPNSLNGEPMHEIEFRIKPRNSFKEWFYITEAIDANTKNLLAKAKAPKDQLDAFIKELEDEPTLIDNKTAFQRFQAKFVAKKEKSKDEDAQRKHFATIPNTTEEELQTYDYYKNENKDSLKKMMEQLRKFIDKKIITLKIENKTPNLYRNTTQGSNKLDTPDFGRFTSQLDSIQGSLEQYKGKGNYFNPIEEELNHQQNLVAKGDNIWVFKGHAPDVCRIYGKGHPWCISSSTSAAHWFTYRIEHHQTQYFVFDYNKDEDDPARYVNPGVSPEGMYSEWVDATNTHDTDPEDSESDVGINGYNSINEYKKYLVSKGIPLTTWTTTPPEDWEKRLHQYDKDRYFYSAKNDKHPEVFPMYLKIVNGIKDSDFDTLTDEQKKEFLLSKIEITDKQFAYAMKEFKGEYYNSLDLTGKIHFSGKTKDQNLLFKLAENPKIDDKNFSWLFYYATDKDKIAELIIENKPELSHHNVRLLLIFAIDKDKIAELLGTDNINKLSDDNVYDLLDNATDKDKITQIIIRYKTELSDNNISHLLKSATDKDKMAELIINKKPELSGRNVYELLKHATDIDKIVKILGTDNINKLSENDVNHLLLFTFERDKMAELIINKKSELSDSNVRDLLHYAKDKDKIAKLIIEKKPELTESNVFNLLYYAIDKDKIAELLQKETDNISKLSKDDVYYLLKNTNDRNKMEQIINKYHTKKTP